MVLIVNLSINITNRFSYICCASGDDLRQMSIIRLYKTYCTEILGLYIYLVNKVHQD